MPQPMRVQPITDRKFPPNVGIVFYGVSAIALGLIGLAWGDFATNWQRVEPGVPFREALAYLAATCEVVGGAAILWRRTAQIGAAMLTVLYVVFTLLWVPKIITAPAIYDSWGNLFEELSLVIGGAVAYCMLAPRDAARARKEAVLSRSYAVCAISFGVVHAVNLRPAASFVPAWIPPGQLFWVVTTMICFFLAAAAILSGILAALASRLLAIMIVGFEVLLWGPRLIAAPHDHFNWAGNGINLVMAGAAWVVADSIDSAKNASRNIVANEVMASR